MQKTVYLDYAAATPMSKAVVDSMLPYMCDEFYNPSAIYEPAVRVRRKLEVMRHDIAKLIGASKDDVVFTSGATESINLAFTIASEGNVVTLKTEHHAVLNTAKQYKNKIIDVGHDGILGIDELKKTIDDNTVLVSVALANNETGVLQNLREISELVSEIRHYRKKTHNQNPIWFHTDASQGVGQVDVNVARLGVDMMTLNSGKIYGPKQIGILWRNSGVDLKPVVFGGGQEMGLRSGTENVAGVAGFLTALSEAQKKRKTEQKRLTQLRDYCQKELENNIKSLEVTGNKKRRLPAHLHVTVPKIDAERVIFELEMKGVFLATGSACAANKNTKSHVLTAMCIDEDRISGSFRITFGRENTVDDIKYATNEIIEVIKKEQKRVGE